LETLLPVDATAPGGAVFASEGLDDPWGEASCVADDGRVGMFAEFVGGQRALLCADVDGVHVVAREYGAEIGGESFWPDVQCAFADGDAMFLGLDWGVFRADPNGIERFIGPGEIADNGSEVWRRIGELDTNQTFGVNRHGTVVVADGRQVLRRRNGGGLEALELERVEGLEAIDEVMEIEIADDDSLFANVQLWGGSRGRGGDRVVHIRDGSAQVIARRGPDRRRGSPRIFERMRWLWARGQMAVFTGESRESERQVLVDLRDGRVRDLAEGLWASTTVDLSADGTALVDSAYWNEQTSRWDYGRFLIDAAGSELLSSRDPIADREVEPLGIGAPGVVLFHRREHGRQSLHINGPAAVGRCPRIALTVPTATPAPTPGAGEDDGCQVGTAEAGSAWLWLGGLALWWRRRNRIRSRPRTLAD
jgi:MYXO-CTERM domain-containing protein